MKRAASAILGASLCVSSYGGAARAQDKAACAAGAEEGQTLRNAKKFGAAREKFLICAQEACPPIVRDDCAKWLEEMEARRPSLVFSAKDRRGGDLTDVRVFADGRPLAGRLDGSAVDIDPGEVKLRFETAGLPPVERTIVIVEGQKSRIIEVIMGAPAGAGPAVGAGPDAPSDGGTFVAPWIFFGVGVAGLAVFGALQGVAQSEYADLEDGCGATRSCTDDEVSSTRAKFTASGVALGVGGAALVTAAVLWIADAAAGPPAAGPRVTAGFGPGGGFVGLTAPLGF